MGMGSYDESEQQRREQTPEEEEVEEQITTDTYDGEVSYETPEDADTLLQKFKENKSSD